MPMTRRSHPNKYLAQLAVTYDLLYCQIKEFEAMRPEQIIPDSEIDRVHANANFGNSLTKRDIVNRALLKCICGYSNGHTADQIICEHGLTVAPRRRGHTAVTQRGRKYLYAVFGDNF